MASTRYVSLGSILAAAAFPVALWWLERDLFPAAALAMCAAAALLVISVTIRTSDAFWLALKAVSAQERHRIFMARIAVIGAGAWGTALSIALGRKGSHQLKLWAYEKEVVESIRTTHVNEPFLSGCPMPESIAATQSLAEAVAGAEIVLSVMPSHHARRVWSQMKPLLHPEMLLVSATKGIENDSLLRMTQVITDVLTHGEGSFQPRLCAISGPTFAREVAKGYPTTLSVASADAGLSAQVQEAFS